MPRPCRCSPVPFLVLLLVWPTLSCSRDASPPAARSIILITIDGLRADVALTTDGTRFRLDDDAIHFESAYSVSPLTRPAYHSIFTGLTPSEHGIESDVSSPDLQVPTFLDQLAERGFATAAFVTSASMARDGSRPTSRPVESPLGRGNPRSVRHSFQHSTVPDSGIERGGGNAAADSLRWIEAQPRDQSFFVWLDLDEPSRAPATSPADATYRDATSTAARIIDQFVNGLDKLDRYRSSAIVVTSPHGRSLGDGGEQEHGLLLHAATLHVPLYLKLPDEARGGERVDRIVSLLDLAPTCVALASGSIDLPLLSESNREGGVVAETRLPQLEHGGVFARVRVTPNGMNVDAPTPSDHDRLVPIGQLFPPPIDETTPRDAPLDEARIARWDLLTQATVAEDAGSIDAAMRLVDTLLLQSPQHRGALLRRAELLRLLHRDDDAIAQLASIDPAFAEGLRLQARWLIETHPADAVPLLKRAVELRPDRFELRRELALATLAAGDVISAAAEFKKSLALRRDPIALAELAHLLVTSPPPVRDAAEGLRLASEAVAARPNDARLLATNAEALAANDDYAAAVDAMTQAIQACDGEIGAYDERLSFFRLKNRSE